MRIDHLHFDVKSVPLYQEPHKGFTAAYENTHVQHSEPYRTVAKGGIRRITCLLRQILYAGDTGINCFRSPVSSHVFLFAPLIWINSMTPDPMYDALLMSSLWGTSLHTAHTNKSPFVLSGMYGWRGLTAFRCDFKIFGWSGWWQRLCDRSLNEAQCWWGESELDFYFQFSDAFFSCLLLFCSRLTQLAPLHSSCRLLGRELSSGAWAWNGNGGI